jgi:tRNA (mo5U34)-methyltransferase
MTAQDVHIGSDELEHRVRELAPWFHNLDLRGVRTAPDHFLGDYPSNKWRRFAHAVPADLSGKTVLDIGCNAGFFSFEMKRRGAARVLGMDSDPRYLRQAKLASEVLGLPLELTNMSVYEVAKLREQFDIVLFTGVFYHLRYPLLALDLIRKYVVRDLLVFQSMVRGTADLEPLQADYPFSEQQIFAASGYPRLHFVEQRYAGDPTNWWIPNRACVEALLRSSGFELLARPEDEVYLCRTDQRASRRQPELAFALDLELEQAREVLP